VPDEVEALAPERSCPAHAIGASAQMFGANQQVPNAGGSYKEAETAARRDFLGAAKMARPIAGSALPLFHRHLAARVALELNISWHHPDLYFFLCLLTGSRGVPGQYFLYSDGNRKCRAKNA
jgi:hypothetical protein